MKKITIISVCVIAFMCLFVSKTSATMHIAMMDEEYLNALQEEYEEKQRKAEEERKAKEAAEAEEKERNQAESAASTSIARAGALEFSENEIQILYKICHAESRGESEKGQMAVANVVLNRVKSSGFPDTIEGVVFQKGQFTPAARSSFHSITPTSQVKASVDKVLAGERVLEDDVLYFKSTSSKAKWGNLKLRAKIGCHLFYSK